MLPEKTDDAIMKRGRMVHSKFSFLICFCCPNKVNHGEYNVTIRLFLYFQGPRMLFNSLSLDLAVFCRSLRDFILQHFFAVGVDGLDQEKLSPLLRLKYNDSMGDACRPRKTFRDKRRLRRISAFFVLGGPGLGE